MDALPRELVRVLSTFAPLEAMFLVRASKSLWARFAVDPWVHAPRVREVLAQWNGIELLYPHARSMLACCPALENEVAGLLTPIPTATDMGDFDLSPDGTLLACGGGGEIVDRTLIRILRAEDSDHGVVAELKGEGRSLQLRFSPSGSMLAALNWGEGLDSAILVFTCATWALTRRLVVTASSPIGHMCFPMDRAIFTSALAPNCLVIMDPESEEETTRTVEEQGVTCLAASRVLVASGHCDRHVRLWTFEGAAVSRFDCESCVSVMCFAADGALLLAMSADGVLRQWNMATRTCERTYDPGTLEARLCVSRTDLLVVAHLTRFHFVAIQLNGDDGEARRIFVDVPYSAAFSPLTAGKHGVLQKLFVAHRMKGATGLSKVML